jgi:hypothetical protein
MDRTGQPTEATLIEVPGTVWDEVLEYLARVDNNNCT